MGGTHPHGETKLISKLNCSPSQIGCEHVHNSYFYTDQSFNLLFYSDKPLKHIENGNHKHDEECKLSVLIIIFHYFRVARQFKRGIHTYINSQGYMLYLIRKSCFI